VFKLDPLKDARWNELLSWHPAATVFHTPEWLGALRQTYGYVPFVVTTAAPSQQLTAGMPVCVVNSRFTGNRLVSVPFSDHCEPLVGSTEELRELLSTLKGEVCQSRYKYFEMRPVSWALSSESGLEKSNTFCLQRVDLFPNESELFARMHRNCIQRKIERAQRQKLIYEEGKSVALLRKFYYLQLMTRSRQQLPPQPFAWFRNLAACMGGKVNVRVVSKGSKPVASILTLQFRGNVVCKYCCSDKLFSNLGSMQLLYWRVIQDAKREGCVEVDLGRSDLENDGLMQFKDRLGAARTTMNYWRYCVIPVKAQGQAIWKTALAKRLFSHLPNVLAPAAGGLLYRHIG
jgi:hypothetical protein